MKKFKAVVYNYETDKFAVVSVNAKDKAHAYESIYSKYKSSNIQVITVI